MVGSEGRAVGVEHIPELVDTSIENIKKSAAAVVFLSLALWLHVHSALLVSRAFRIVGCL